MSSAGARRTVSLALLATLLLRAAIPDGYMPAPIGSGLLVELCPAGVPASFMEALAGSTGHRHHDDSANDSSRFDAGQCPIGHLLSAAAAIDMPALQAEPPAATTPGSDPTEAPVFARANANRSRGPPA